MADAAALNFEVQPAFNLTVQVEDRSGLQDAAVVTVNLNDLLEAPEANDQAFVINEDLPTGSVIGTLAVLVDQGETPVMTILI